MDPAVPLLVAAERERRERRSRRKREKEGEDEGEEVDESVVEGVLRSLNREAGLAALAGPGISPSGDMRDVIAAAEREEREEEEEKAKGKGGSSFFTSNSDGSESVGGARLALSVYVHRIRHYLGAYLLNRHLNGEVHAIIFTGGVGENSPLIRERVLEGLERFGIEVDAVRNEAAVGSSKAVRIDKGGGGKVAVVVVPADEEAVIAREAWEVAMRVAKEKK